MHSSVLRIKYPYVLGSSSNLKHQLLSRVNVRVAECYRELTALKDVMKTEQLSGLVLGTNWPRSVISYVIRQGRAMSPGPLMYETSATYRTAECTKYTRHVAML